MIKNLLCIFLSLSACPAMAKLQVVTTLTDYQVIARFIGGEHVEAISIVQPDDDPHFVRPKPSHVVKIKKADLFVTTGLDLELWAPSLLDRAANPRVRSGQLGYVAAATGLSLIEKPGNLSRSEGGLHMYGNPHITLSPLNMVVIARNIATGLAKVDPENKPFYEKNYLAFKQSLVEQIFGKEIPELLGADVTVKMAQQGTLASFLQARQHQGRPLIEKLGGWLGRALPLRSVKFVSYHRSWGYLEDALGIKSIATIEDKPGVPPTPKHVVEVVQKMKSGQVKLIIGANYFPVDKMKNVAEKTGAELAVLPMNARADAGKVMEKFDEWLNILLNKTKIDRPK